ncbi:MAG: hypothetical protein QXK24_09090 [Ignisphaera sp.]
MEIWIQLKDASKYDAPKSLLLKLDRFSLGTTFLEGALYASCTASLASKSYRIKMI